MWIVFRPTASATLGSISPGDLDRDEALRWAASAVQWAGGIIGPGGIRLLSSGEECPGGDEHLAEGSCAGCSARGTGAEQWVQRETTRGLWGGLTR